MAENAARGLIRQGMQRPLDHIGKDPLPPRRKTAAQRIVHRVLPQDARNPNPATRPPSGVFCQINPTKLQCLLQQLARAIHLPSRPNNPSVEPAEQSSRQARIDSARWQACIDPPASPHRPGLPTNPHLRHPPTGSHRPDPPKPTSHQLADKLAPGSPTGRHQSRRRPFPIFQKTSRPFSMWLAKTQHTKGTAMNDFSNKLGGKRGSGPLNPLPLQ